MTLNLCLLNRVCHINAQILSLVMSFYIFFSFCCQTHYFHPSRIYNLGWFSPEQQLSHCRDSRAISHVFFWTSSVQPHHPIKNAFPLSSETLQVLNTAQTAVCRSCKQAYAMSWRESFRAGLNTSSDINHAWVQKQYRPLLGRAKVIIAARELGRPLSCPPCARSTHTSWRGTCPCASWGGYLGALKELNPPCWYIYF